MRRLNFLGGIVGLLLAVSSMALADGIDQCGELVVMHDCLYFQPFQGGNWYSLEDYGGFGVHDIVRVAGTTGYQYPGCSIYGDNVITDNTIVACQPRDLGCYRLYVPEPGDDRYCPHILYPDCGPLFVPPGEFASGDSVRVLGVPDCRGGWVCSVVGSVQLVTVKACSDTITAVQPMSWGRVKALYR